MALTKQELKQAFKDAVESGHVEYFDKNKVECSSECENCPASEACEQLSEKQDYKTFLINYRELMKDIHA